jgi:diacylglycerol kinase (ATP)
MYFGSRLMRVIFIIHGAKKELRHLPKALETMRPKHMQFYFCVTSDFGTGKQIAYENASKADIMTAIGGDGLLNECLNGLMIYQRENPTAKIPAITMLPYGSGNDFARSFNWKPKSIEDFIQRLERCEIKKIDIGRIVAESGRTECFINEASTGLTTKVVERVSSLPKFLSGGFKYGWAILEVFLTYRKKVITIEYDGVEWSGKVLLVACNNGKYFGSGICIAPDADPFDGMLDITIIGDVTILQYLRHLGKLRRGDKLNIPEVHYIRASKLKLTGDLRIEKEGERGSRLPCTVSIGEQIDILV